MNQGELQQLVEEISRHFFNRPFKHQATFNSRLRTTGGRYHLRSHDLDFNPQVLEKLGKDVLIGVIKHELCHYHLHLQGKGHQHKDKDFKDLLKEVGGIRYVPSLRGQKEKVMFWQYKCTGCGLTAKRQRRFNTQKFICSKCKSSFVLVGREKVTS
ncbi:SprT family protein [Alkalibacterium iburiense]|uniref:SprT family protein n=1 Tax=Alkalibacterium iburiense TaxID=290589 RepID=A0ABN0XMD5_9LACT